MKTLAMVIPAVFFGSLAAADESSLAQCARVDDATARLACYDAVAGRAPTQGVGTGLPAAPAAPVAAAAPASYADFGKPGSAADVMTARIVGKLTEWGSGTLIKLDNGQVWRAVEDRSAVYPNVPENAEVEITRGIFGYRLEIKAIGRRISVRRVS